MAGDRSGWDGCVIRFGSVSSVHESAMMRAGVCFLFESRGVASAGGVRVASNGYPGGTGAGRGWGLDRMDGWMDRDSSDHQKD